MRPQRTEEAEMEPRFEKVRIPLAAVAAVAALAGSAAHAAGVVEVRFVDPEHYADAGIGKLELGRTTSDFERHLRRWAARLPQGQTLKIDVLDIDLAGTERPYRDGRPLRVLRGGADWPRVKLHYALDEGGRTLKSGDEVLADLDYLRRVPVPSVLEGRAYEHEFRMLDQWFEARILGGTAGAAAG
jgi:hypothetical protein